MVHRLVLGLAKASLLGVLVAPDQMRAALLSVKLTPDYATIPILTRPRRFSPDSSGSAEEEEC